MIKRKTFLTFILAGMLSVFAGAATAQTESAPDHESNQIVGSWLVTVTPEGAPVPFRGLITFTQDGGVIASAQGDVLLDAPPGVPPVATAGHGAWVRTGRTFRFTFRQIFSNADGTYAGGAKISHSVRLNAGGNGWTGSLSVEIYDADGNVVFSGTGTETAVRIRAES
jgi:hypothetical protein